jgi:uncharacterized protein YvpB
MDLQRPKPVIIAILAIAAALSTVLTATSVRTAAAIQANTPANWEDSAWNGWTATGGLTSNTAVVNSGPNRMSVFGRGEDNALWIRSWDGTTWGGWSSLGGALTSDPAAVSWGTDRIDVLVRGTDMGLYHRYWSGGNNWSGWEALGGILASAPTVASWGPGRLDIFARGADDALWSIAWAGTQWTGWYSLGGRITATPAAASWGPNRIDVFVRGGDGALWHRAWSGLWYGWEPLGGWLTSAPAASSWGPGRIDVFVRGGDDAAWHNAWVGTQWTGWQPLGGYLTSQPEAVSFDANRIDLFVRSSANVVYQTGWDGAAWSGWRGLGLTASAIFLNDIPAIRQQYELSCEEAALQMALAHEGTAVNQTQELNDIGIDWRAGYYQGNTLRWGDPYVNFVGDPNGSEVALTGYGTYDTTISRIASGYTGIVDRAGEGISPQDIYTAVLGNHPAVVWVAFDWKYHSPGSLLAFDSRWVQYEGPVEHAVTVVGISGGSVYVYNPWFGPQWIDKATFEAAYNTYNDMAVILQ